MGHAALYGIRAVSGRQMLLLILACFFRTVSAEPDTLFNYAASYWTFKSFMKVFCSLAASGAISALSIAPIIRWYWTGGKLDDFIALALVYTFTIDDHTKLLLIVATLYFVFLAS